MIRAVREHQNRFSYSQMTVQKGGVNYNEANILLLVFNRIYFRSDKTTEPELVEPWDTILSLDFEVF